MTDRSGPGLAEAAAARGWDPDAPDVELSAVSGGLINATYAVSIAGRTVATLQRLHQIFGISAYL